VYTRPGERNAVCRVVEPTSIPRVSGWADPQTGVIGVLFCQLQNPDKVTPLQKRFREAVRASYRLP
jgi:hypothetical protein